ncbi:MAG: DUF2797 domain-containing protein [Bacteriovoracales bacterium]|nr:DUF2797 domain-containing protein [Bacteriovoracales bacterium]
MVEGNLLKMKSTLKEVVDYVLPVGSESIPLNELVGQRVKISYLGQINDIYDGSVIKKSYAQGYSYKNFISLARCDSCIVQPEKCHHHKGTCREPGWGEENCFVDHVVYLAVTSAVKVGITRRSQIPTRWIDQGAVKAIPLVIVKDRLTAGLIEVEMKSAFGDKTNWRKMLGGENELLDLTELREGVFDQFADLFDDHGAEEAHEGEITIDYPVKRYPEKIKSVVLDKNPVIDDVLCGIKGQYLIFEKSVFNVRNHQGYRIRLAA